MKPFDLEAAKNGAKICTRNGYAARLLATDVKCTYPIVVAVTFSNGNELAFQFTKDGKDDVYVRPGIDVCEELMMVEENDHPLIGE